MSIGILILVVLVVGTVYVLYSETIGSKRDYDRRVRERGGPDPSWDAFRRNGGPDDIKRKLE